MLSVEPAEQQRHFHGISGGGRLRAFNEQAKRKLVNQIYKVLWQFYDSEDAAGFPLIKNVMRKSMYPCDPLRRINQLASAARRLSESQNRLLIFEIY